MKTIEDVIVFLNSISANKGTLSKDKSFIYATIRDKVLIMQRLVQEHNELSTRLKQMTDDINNIGAEIMITSALLKEMLEKNEE